MSETHGGGGDFGRLEKRIESIDERVRSLESSMTGSTTNIQSLKDTLNVHTSQCPKEDLYEKLDELTITVSKTTSSVDTLRKFILPLISFGNIAALTILLILFNNINTHTEKLTNKFDSFVQTYQQSEINLVKQLTKFESQMNDNDELKKELSDLRKEVEDLKRKK